jgi:hypothetical protein
LGIRRSVKSLKILLVNLMPPRAAYILCRAVNKPIWYNELHRAFMCIRITDLAAQLYRADDTVIYGPEILLWQRGDEATSHHPKHRSSGLSS